MIITVSNLNLWYGDFQALKDINVSFGEKQITAIIGPSDAANRRCFGCLTG